MSSVITSTISKRDRLHKQADKLWDDLAQQLYRAIPEKLADLMQIWAWDNISGFKGFLESAVNMSDRPEPEHRLINQSVADAMGFDSLEAAAEALDEFKAAWASQIVIETRIDDQGPDDLLVVYFRPVEIPEVDQDEDLEDIESGEDQDSRFQEANLSSCQRDPSLPKC